MGADIGIPVSGVCILSVSCEGVWTFTRNGISVSGVERIRVGNGDIHASDRAIVDRIGSDVSSLLVSNKRVEDYRIKVVNRRGLFVDCIGGLGDAC